MRSLLAPLPFLVLAGCASWPTLRHTVPDVATLPATDREVVYVHAQDDDRSTQRLARAIRDALLERGVPRVEIGAPPSPEILRARGEDAVTIEITMYREWRTHQTTGRRSPECVVVGCLRETVPAFAWLVETADLAIHDARTGESLADREFSEAQWATDDAWQSTSALTTDGNIDWWMMAGRLAPQIAHALSDEDVDVQVELDPAPAASHALAIALQGDVHRAREELEEIAAREGLTPEERGAVLFDLGQLRRLDRDTSAADAEREERERFDHAASALLASRALLADARVDRAIEQLEHERGQRWVRRQRAHDAAMRGAPTP